MSTNRGLCWVIKLSADHPSFQEVHLYREEGYPGYDVVVVNSDAFMQLTENASPSWVIPPVDDWKTDKRNGIFTFLRPPGAVPMPTVALLERQFQTVERRWLIFKMKTEHSVMAISYTNGRHRARYLHWAGAKFFPVLCDKSEAKLLQDLCGWNGTA